MTNHVHLVLTPNTVLGISRLIQSIGRRYVRYVNEVYARTGTLWEGRHKGHVIQSERHLLQCYQYVELNPVRAGMVTSPANYSWPSYRHHGLGEQDPIKDYINGVKKIYTYGGLPAKRNLTVVDLQTAKPFSDMLPMI